MEIFRCLSHMESMYVYELKKKVKTKNDLIFFLPKKKVQTLDFFLFQKEKITALLKKHTLKLLYTEEFSSQATPTPLHCSFGDALRRIES